MKENEIEKLRKKFYQIKRQGWIESVRNDFSGIGMTFESLMGIPNNEFEIPDFGSIELKTKTSNDSHHITLFNCTPTGPHFHEVERLKNLYGYPDSVLKKYRVLNTDVYCNKFSKTLSNFLLKININKYKKEIILTIYDKNEKILESEVYWSFDILEEKLYRKLSYLALIKADKKVINKKKYYKYYEMKIYALKDFNTFLKLMEKGIIRICFKIGIFRSGSKMGHIHDRGTSFGIKEENLKYLYDLVDLYK